MEELKIPKGEIVWCRYVGKDKKVKFLLTSKPSRENYILYKVVNGKCTLLGKGSNPPYLEERFDVNAHIQK